jgi:RecA-family ATPase
MFKENEQLKLQIASQIAIFE